MCTLGFRDSLSLSQKYRLKAENLHNHKDSFKSLKIKESPTNNSHDVNVMHTAAVATLGGGNPTLNILSSENG